MEKNIEEAVRKWLIKADNNIKAASQLFEVKEIITDAICFHCQQAVEKYMKAYLVSKEIAPDKTHKLEILLTQCMGFEPSFEEIQNVKYLTEYAVELRYPDDFYVPSVEEAREAYEMAEKVKNFVLNLLK
ncbi:MAG: hypothetical protein HW421_49 [Ignavibacteria bacterium]|nr:hypothetical protein [Ignavibacteria bacterium]